MFKHALFEIKHISIVSHLKRFKWGNTINEYNYTVP